MHPRPPRRQALRKLEIQPIAGQAMPTAVADFLADAGARIDNFFDHASKSLRSGFFPSDYELVYGVLNALRVSNPDATRLCEWGSGLGVVAGLGAMLGYQACGIEIDARWVSASRALLKEYNLDVEILEGSFIPEEFAENNDMRPDGSGTILWGPGAIDEVDVEIEDFDLVFAFPWPDEEEMYFDLFARYASVGAILTTYSALEGILVQRKMAR